MSDLIQRFFCNLDADRSMGTFLAEGNGGSDYVVSCDSVSDYGC